MFNFIILLEVLFSLIKCYDDNDRIKEIQFGNHSIVFEEKIIYYYMNIESMDIDNRNEGTIILNGTIKDINQYLFKYSFGYNKNNFTEENEKIYIGEIIYDSKFNLYEIYYKIEKKYKYLKFKILTNETNNIISIQASQPVLNYNLTKLKENITCDLLNIPCYIRLIKKNENPNEKSNILIFTSHNHYLIYKNKTINPNEKNRNISNIIEQSKYIFNSIEYNTYENYFYLILKIVPTKEQSSIEIRIEITKEKVLIFNGEVRNEKIFQLDISQNEQNSFYIIECYNVQNDTFILNNQQESLNYDILYNNNFTNGILNETNYQIININEFYDILKRYEIIHVKFKKKGNLILRFFPKRNEIKIKNTTFNHIYISPNSLKLIEIYLNNNNSKIFLSITNLGKEIPLISWGNYSDIQVIINYSCELTNDTELYIDSNYAKSYVFLEIMVNYDNTNYTIVENDTTRLSDSILIKLKNKLDYYKILISLESQEELNFKSYFSFCISEEYFPVLNNDNIIVYKKLHNNKTNWYLLNPHDIYEISTDYNFYYYLKFDFPINLTITIKYLEKTIKSQLLLENNYEYVNSHYSIYNPNHYKYIFLMFYFCNFPGLNKISISYEDEEIYNKELYKNQYNFLKISPIHNNFHIDVLNNKFPLLFSYKSSNTDINVTFESHNKNNTKNNKNIEFQENKEGTFIISNKNLIENYKVTKINIYLLSKTKKNLENYAKLNLCYLNQRKKEIDNDIENDIKYNGTDFLYFSKYGNYYNFNSDKKINGNWLMIVVSEYYDIVPTQFIIFEGNVSIHNGKVRLNNEKKLFLTLFLVFLVFISLFIIFIFKYFNLGKEDNINQYNISLVGVN